MQMTSSTSFMRKYSMRLGSLFDGIGGALLCARLSGIEPVWASEIEAFPIKVTQHHFPEVKHYGDITQMNGAKIEPVDIIVGGSPCQDLSVAGKRAGLEGERSGLFMDMIRIIKEMREATNNEQPRYMVWENVPGAFSSNGGEDFRAVIEETARIAEETISIPGPSEWRNAGSVLGDDFSISWRTFDAQYWGVPQRRRRIYLVADFGGQSAPEILFESESLQGNPAESRGKGQGIAEDAERSVGSAVTCGLVSKGNGEAFLMKERHMSLSCGGGQAGQGYPAIVERCVGSAGFKGNQGSKAGGIGFEAECAPTVLAGQEGHVVCFEPGAITRDMGVRHWEEISPTLRAEAFDNRPAICVQGSMIGRADKNGPQGSGVNEDVSFTLNATDRHAVVYGMCSLNSNSMKSDNPHSGIYEADTSRTIDQNGGNPACNQGGMLVFENHGQDSRYTGPLDVAPVVNATYGMGGNNQPFVVEGMKSDNQFANYTEGVGTLRANGGDLGGGSESLIANQSVRKLTPLECERLQGYPDGWTDMGSDTARYKALGNSFAIPCALFVIRGIYEKVQKQADHA